MFLLLDGVVSLNSFSFRFFRFVVFVFWCRSRSNGRQCSGTIEYVYGMGSMLVPINLVHGQRQGEKSDQRSPGIFGALTPPAWVLRQYCLNTLYTKYIERRRVDESGAFNNLKYHVKHGRRQLWPQLSQLLMVSGKKDNFWSFSRARACSLSCLWLFLISSNLPQYK